MVLEKKCKKCHWVLEKKRERSLFEKQSGPYCVVIPFRTLSPHMYCKIMSQWLFGSAQECWFVLLWKSIKQRLIQITTFRSGTKERRHKAPYTCLTRSEGTPSNLYHEATRTIDTHFHPPLGKVLVHHEQRLFPSTQVVLSACPYNLKGNSLPTKGVRENSEDSAFCPGNNKMFLVRVHPHTLRPY